MTYVIRFACVCMVVVSGSAYAQDPAPAAAPDSSAPTAVTTFSIKSGKIALSSATSTKPIFLPDGTYTNEGGTILVILDGVIARLQRESGEITQIDAVHMNRDRVIMLTPSTNALMQVADMRLPSGTFTSGNRRSSFTIVLGRPTAFTLPSGS